MWCKPHGSGVGEGRVLSQAEPRSDVGLDVSLLLLQELKGSHARHVDGRLADGGGVELVGRSCRQQGFLSDDSTHHPQSSSSSEREREYTREREREREKRERERQRERDRERERQRERDRERERERERDTHTHTHTHTHIRERTSLSTPSSALRTALTDRRSLS